MDNLTVQNKLLFTAKLMQWHEQDNHRSLPWKGESDPYRIWLSEIILQQTRAEQGEPYYLNFIEKYPTISQLANADESEVFRLWQGLGYYNRCRNMLSSAKFIVETLAGNFPNNYEALLKLKGIGPYTAAAISSFAYNIPKAVVDGNVYRVLARYFGIETASDSTEGKFLFSELANELLERENPSGYNQAIMDFGATVCTPKQSKCSVCPLSVNCFAFRHDLLEVFPVKKKKIEIVTRYFNYLILIAGNSVWIHERTGNDIWQNLNEPFLIETPYPLEKLDLLNSPEYGTLGLPKSGITFTDRLVQKLTHRKIVSAFYTLDMGNTSIFAIPGGKWTDVQDLPRLPFPKTILIFFKKHGYIVDDTRK